MVRREAHCAALSVWLRTLLYEILFVGSLGPKKSGGAQLTFTVRNTGKRAGAEVAQVYVGDPASTGEPPKQLEGYQRVSLKPGQSKRVTISVSHHAFAYWNAVANGWRVAPGCYSLMVGTSSADLPCIRWRRAGRLSQIAARPGILPGPRPGLSRAASEREGRGQGAALQDPGPQLPRQDAAGAQQLVEQDRPPHKEVQRVLGGEADAGQHLLTVPRHGAGLDRPAKALAMPAVTGEGSSQTASRSAAAASRATRLSPGARRWRTALKEAMGRPNCTRSSACVRAKSSMARPAPTSSCPRASCPRAAAAGQSAAFGCAAHAASDWPTTSNTPSAGSSRPPSGWRGEQALSTARCSTKGRPADHKGRRQQIEPRAPDASPAPAAVRPSAGPGPCPSGLAGAAPPRPLPRAHRVRCPTANRVRPSWSPPPPGIRRPRRPRWGGRQTARPRQPRSSSAASSAAPPARSAASRMPLSKRAPLRRFHHRSAPRSSSRRAMMLR